MKVLTKVILFPPIFVNSAKVKRILGKRVELIQAQPIEKLKGEC